MKLSKTRLRILGFADKMIDTFLPPPEIYPRKNKGVSKQWEEAEVRKVMQTTEFKVARNEYMLSLNGHAIQRVKRKIEAIQRQNNSGGELEEQLTYLFLVGHAGDGIVHPLNILVRQVIRSCFQIDHNYTPFILLRPGFSGTG